MSSFRASRRCFYWIAGVCLAVGLACGNAYAQADEKQEPETKKVTGISAKTYEKFAKAQELVEAGDYQGGLKILEDVKNKKKLSATEAMQLYQFYGIVYFTMERYEDAIRAFETMLRQEGIEPRQQADTLYTIAQLHFTIEDWQSAVDTMTKWFAIVDNPPPDPYILLASAHYSLDQYDEMIPAIETAMDIARTREKEVKEQWWLLLRVAYYEKNDIPKVTEILEVLVVNWPKKEYWTMLSGMYGELNKEQRQLGAYASAYDQDLLTKSTEVVTFAQLLMQAEVPYKAGRVIEKGLADGVVEENEGNYRLLSQAWQMSGEFDKAIPALKKAAATSDDGKLDLRLASSYLNLGRYEECVDAARTALRRKVERPAAAQELLAMCLFELEKYEDAKKAFRLAAKDEKIQKRARNWIKFIENEQSRLAQLDESIRQARAARNAARNQIASPN